MGKIVSSFFISLDGVVEAPDQWHFPYFNEEMGGAIGKAAETTDAFLMGRVVYEEWAGYWPTSTDEPFASFLNNTPKYVVSRTLQEASWNNTTIINGDVAAGIRDLKDRTQRDIGMSGSATLVRWLLANGLLDRLNLLVHPIVVGKGQRLFEDTPTHPLRLLSQETFSTGVLNLAYAPADT
ncbi:MAG: dihydrofolate reductase family protein [Actinomycetes bacterium]